MALSNWDTLAFNEKSESTDGMLKLPNGSRVEIYKNWLYVYGASNEDDTSPIATVYNGTVRIGNFDISAVRNKQQNAVFMLAECLETKSAMVGIGCSGFSDPLEALATAFGVDLTQHSDVSRYSSSLQNGRRMAGIMIFEKDSVSRHEIEDDGRFSPVWIGITNETLSTFFGWLEEAVKNTSLLSKEFVDKCKAATPMRFNQGDAFFAGKIGKDVADVATKVADANQPILLTLLNDDKTT
jgi:hypothetical protein